MRRFHPNEITKGTASSKRSNLIEALEPILSGNKRLWRSRAARRYARGISKLFCMNGSRIAVLFSSRHHVATTAVGLPGSVSVLAPWPLANRCLGDQEHLAQHAQHPYVHGAPLSMCCRCLSRRGGAAPVEATLRDVCAQC